MCIAKLGYEALMDPNGYKEVLWSQIKYEK